MRQRPDPLPRGVLPLRARTTRRRWSGRTSSGGCATTYPHLDPDTVFEEARREEVCPFEVQLELAQRADAIVADYNYVFEPARRAAAPDGRGPARGDPARGRGAQPARPRAADLLARAPRGGPRARCATASLLQPGDLFADLAASVEDLLAILERGRRGAAGGRGDRRDRRRRPRRSSTLRADWEPKLLRYLAWKRETRLALVDDPVLDVHFALQRFARRARRCSGPTSPASSSGAQRGVRLALVCLDPARALAPVFRQASSTVLLSATLTPPEAIQRVLGPRAGPHVVDLAAAAVPAREPQGHDRAAPCARPSPRARRTTAGSRGSSPRCPTRTAGNDLVLFPSYRFLTEVAARMPPTRSRLLVQRPDLTGLRAPAAPRRALPSPPPGGTLLFAVSGGMYAEGVDYPGELLSAVFVVSPALPQVSFERELLRRYFDEKEEAGFDYAYLQPGHDARRAGGRPADPQRDRPRRHRARLRALPRGALRAAGCRATGTTRRRASSRRKRPADEIREFFERYGEPPPVCGSVREVQPERAREERRDLAARHEDPGQKFPLPQPPVMPDAANASIPL